MMVSDSAASRCENFVKKCVNEVHFVQQSFGKLLNYFFFLPNNGNYLFAASSSNFSGGGGARATP